MTNESVCVMYESKQLKGVIHAGAGAIQKFTIFPTGNPKSACLPSLPETFPYQHEHFYDLRLPQYVSNSLAI